MTKVPKPSDLTGTYAATYDAWNRLTFVWVDSDSDGTADAGETVVAKYEYDALNRRTKECLNADTDDDFDSFRHFYYNTDWQLLETRLSTSENDGPEGLAVEMQYVWSARYIDAPVLRDRDADDDPETGDLGVADSGLEERLYYLADANMNVTALTEADGDVVERYLYDPYGKVTILNGANGVDKDGAVTEWTEDTDQTASDVDNNILYGGYYHDWETGLYSVRNRYYHPQLGWIIRDPAGYADGMSLYEYVGCAPCVRYDPFGMSWYGDLGDDAKTAAGAVGQCALGVVEAATGAPFSDLAPPTTQLEANARNLGHGTAAAAGAALTAKGIADTATGAAMMGTGTAMMVAGAEGGAVVGTAVEPGGGTGVGALIGGAPGAAVTAAGAELTVIGVIETVVGGGSGDS